MWTLLRKLPIDMTYCYADNVTLVVPFGKVEDKNAQILQGLLDVCTEWSSKTGLNFNVKKRHRVNLGQRRSPECDFKLCNQIVTEETRIEILGVWFSGNRADPMEDMKNKAMGNGYLCLRDLKHSSKGAPSKP